MKHEEILKEYGITRTENGHKVDEEVLFMTHASLLNQFRELKKTLDKAKELTEHEYMELKTA